MLGVLGGMGPLATADFFTKLVASTPGDRDADQLPVIIRSIPQIPDRNAAIMGYGPSPIAEMVHHARALKADGAQLAAMPCNTAHHWYSELVAKSGLPFIHIADAVIEHLRERGIDGIPVGLIATPGTMRSGFYQKKLAAQGYTCLIPNEADLNQVYRCIGMVKAGKFDQARDVFGKAVAELTKNGAHAVILGCTELPAVLGHNEAHIDSNMALAQACVRRCTTVQPTAATLPRTETCVSI